MKLCLIDGCPSPSRSRGWCTKHYNRWVRHGDAAYVGPGLHDDEVERFHRFIVIDEDDHWIWTGTRSRGGYGSFGIESGPTPTHRWTYRHYIGPIPDGFQIDHLCRVRACCNPAHLEAVTARENNLRGVGHAAVNARKTECIRGHPFDEKNTWTSKSGGRYCRACALVRYHARKAAS